jgi:hypothetical protein
MDIALVGLWREYISKHLPSLITGVFAFGASSFVRLDVVVQFVLKGKAYNIKYMRNISQ